MLQKRQRPPGAQKLRGSKRSQFLKFINIKVEIKEPPFIMHDYFFIFSFYVPVDLRRRVIRCQLNYRLIFLLFILYDENHHDFFKTDTRKIF